MAKRGCYSGNEECFLELWSIPEIFIKNLLKKITRQIGLVLYCLPYECFNLTDFFTLEDVTTVYSIAQKIRQIVPVWYCLPYECFNLTNFSFYRMRRQNCQKIRQIVLVWYCLIYECFNLTNFSSCTMRQQY